MSSAGNAMSPRNLSGAATVHPVVPRRAVVRRWIDVRESRVLGRSHLMTSSRAGIVLTTILFLLFNLSCSQQQSPSQASPVLIGRKSEGQPLAPGERPIIAAWVSGGWDDPDPCSLVLVVFANGYVLFADSKEPHHRCLRAGQIPKALVEEATARLRDLGFFSFSEQERSHYGPDAAAMSLLAVDRGEMAVLTSWHELYADDKNVVATSHGLMLRGDRPLEELLDPPGSEYARFRRVWDEAKAVMGGLLPRESEPFQGDGLRMIEMLDRVQIAW